MPLINHLNKTWLIAMMACSLILLLVSLFGLAGFWILALQAEKSMQSRVEQKNIPIEKMVKFYQNTNNAYSLKALIRSEEAGFSLSHYAPKEGVRIMVLYLTISLILFLIAVRLALNEKYQESRKGTSCANQ